ncbi:MAG: peptidoglycan DD-metalloendopeptidase family protein [Patescibacteria group bacterium]
MNKNILYVLMLIAISLPVTVSAAWGDYDGGAGFGGRMSQWRNNPATSQIQNSVSQLSPIAVQELPIPVLFGVAIKNLYRNFGDPRAGHTHEGLDIMAAEGVPVVSPTDAVVVHIGFDAGAGNFVTVAAPGSESFVFMHLSKVANIIEGTVLKPGDIVGYVGHTGNAVAESPHLHFELHNNTNVAVDPFPRLTKEFTLQQKIQFLTTIINNDAVGRDPLSDLLVTKFRTDFVAAKAQGIALPPAIEAAMLRNPVSTSTVTGNSTGTLKLGSRGPEVATLQAYLIKKNIGSASRVVADGSFGPITKQAVIDFQAAVGLVADGVYGPKSKAYAVSHP